MPLDDLLRVTNPLRDEEGRLRPSLLPGLLNAVRSNISRGASSVALYETGLVFAARSSSLDPRLPEQIDRLAWVLAGPVGTTALDAGPLASDGHLSLALARHIAAVLDVGEIRIAAASPPGYHPGRAAEVSVGGPGDRIRRRVEPHGGAGL